MPKVSVIIPTCNRPHFITQAVKSVLRQTYQNLEVIVVDDGLEIRAESSLKQFNDPRLIYIKNEKNLGGAATRNRGIHESRGEFVAFLDDDDEWIPEKLTVQMKEFEDTPAEVGFCFSAVTNVYDDHEEITRVESGVRDFREDVAKRFKGFLTVTLVIKRFVLEEVGGFDESLPSHQDPELILRIAEKYKGLGIDRSLVRVHMKSGHEHIGGKLSRRIAGRKKLLEKHSDFYVQRPKVLAGHYFQIGLWYRDDGDRKKAAEYFWKSFRKGSSFRSLFHFFVVKIPISFGILRRLFGFLAGFLFAFLLAEVVLRIFLPMIEPEQFSVEDGGKVLRPHDALQHVFVPHSLGHDANGFKNENVLENYKIVALGDSHTHGTYDEDEDVSWPRYLSDMLETPVYNMGIAGYGTAQYAYLLEKALSFKPEVIVVALYTGNDFFNTYDVVYHLPAWEESRLSDFSDNTAVYANELKKTHIPFKSARDFLRDKSVFYTFLGNNSRMFRERIGLSSPRNVGTRGWSTTDPDASLIYDAVPELETLFWVGSRIKGVDLEDKNIREGVRLTKDFLSDMHQKTKEDNTRLVVVLLPMKESVYYDAVHRAGLHNNLYEKVVKYETEIRDDILTYCTQVGIPCFDAFDHLKKELDHGVSLYPKTWDEHPTALGYRAYAEAIVRSLSVQ